MDELMKTERVLEGNLCSIFAVLMSLCDSDTNSQAESMCEFPELEKKMDSMGLLKLIKKLIYMGGDLHTRHNKAKAHINQRNLNRDRFRSIQDLRDQYLEMKKVCDFGLHFGRFESGLRAVLREKESATLFISS